MTEVLWHGRGGQGAFTAARLLGAAASIDDAAYALAFPSFGPERRGAPMRAFTKISASPIGDRSAIKQADFVIYLDETLMAAGYDAELAQGGMVLVNAASVPACAKGDNRVRAIDANAISTEILGRPIPNTVFLGALAELGVLPVQNVKRAIELYMPAKLHDANKKIVDVAAASFAVCPSGADATDGEEVVSGGEGASRVDDEFARPECIIPSIQHDELDPAQFARSTCFAGGHLVEKNAGWRNDRPVIDRQKCVGCLQCYLYCPDGTIFKVPAAEGSKNPFTVAVDYDFCKGCGMCVRACKFDAIRMEQEVQG